MRQRKKEREREKERERVLWEFLAVRSREDMYRSIRRVTDRLLCWGQLPSSQKQLQANKNIKIPGFLYFLFVEFQGAAKGVPQKEFDHYFFVFGMLSVTFRSLFLMLLSLFSSLFCQTPFAGLLLRQGENFESESERKSLGFFVFFVACYYGLCVPNMFITKAHAKENLGEFVCLSITKAQAK